MQAKIHPAGGEKRVCYRLLLCSHRQSGGKALSADSKINEWPIESHKSTKIVNALFLIYLPWIEDPIICAIIRKYLEICSACSVSPCPATAEVEEDYD